MGSFGGARFFPFAAAPSGHFSAGRARDPASARGQVITTFKDSALASLISLPDLTFQALEVMAISRMTFEVWISAGAIYLLLGVLCARYGRWLETRETWKA